MIKKISLVILSLLVLFLLNFQPVESSPELPYLDKIGVIFPDGWKLAGYSYNEHNRQHIYICVNDEGIYRFCHPKVVNYDE